MIAFSVPIRTGRGLNDRGGHWSKRYKMAKAESDAVLWLAPKVAPKPLPAVIWLVRVSPSHIPMDGDNLQGALKAVRDGVARWFDIDDGDERLSWHYGQRRGEWAVEIRVVPATGTVPQSQP